MSATSISSGALASGSTTVLFTGHNFLNTIVVNSDGTNTATVTVYDNTAASGKVLVSFSVSGANLNGAFEPKFPIRADTGLTVVVAGTGATAYVMYGAT